MIPNLDFLLIPVLIQYLNNLHMIYTCLFINFLSPIIKPISFFSQMTCLVLNKFEIAIKKNLSHILSRIKDELFKNIKSLQNNFIITCVEGCK